MGWPEPEPELVGQHSKLENGWMSIEQDKFAKCDEDTQYLIQFKSLSIRRKYSATFSNPPKNVSDLAIWSISLKNIV